MVNKDSFKSSELCLFTRGNANKFVLSCFPKISFVEKNIVLLLPFAGRSGGKLAILTVVNLTADVSYIRVPCCAASIVVFQTCVGVCVCPIVQAQ